MISSLTIVLGTKQGKRLNLSARNFDKLLSIDLEQGRIFPATFKIEESQDLLRPLKKFKDRTFDNKGLEIQCTSYFLRNIVFRTFLTNYCPALIDLSQSPLISFLFLLV